MSIFYIISSLFECEYDVLAGLGVFFLLVAAVGAVIGQIIIIDSSDPEQ